VDSGDAIRGAAKLGLPAGIVRASIERLMADAHEEIS
jgi:hypothetical protein